MASGADKPSPQQPAPQQPAQDSASTNSTKQGRGKQRRQAQRNERLAAARVVSMAPTGPVEQPAFWFGFDVPWAKLVVLRFVFFALLAVDALLNFSHAPRYAAGDFNVAQLPFLDELAPTRVSYAIGQLVCAWLFVLIACGVATRILVPTVAAIYGWLYFSSHLDSYQHHYLVWLVLFLACFVPWDKPADAVPGTRIRSWALRLICIQLAILYLWAAISKLSLAWIDGRTLGAQIHNWTRDVLDATVGIKLASEVVVIIELALAATIWNKRTWWIAAPLGIALHAGILATSLEIGLFAWLMLALYLFILPDAMWVWLAETEPMPTLRGLTGVVADWFTGALGWIALVMSAGAGLLFALVARYDYGAIVGLALTGVLMGLAVYEPRRVGRLAGASLFAFVVWTVVDRASSSASDYYRFWGGSSRRLGDLKTSEYAYRKMTEVAPRDAQGHLQLGKLLLARDAAEQGLAELRLAQQLEPLKSGAYTAEAKWLATHGKTDEAIAKAREATIVDPKDDEARSLLQSLGGQ